MNKCLSFIPKNEALQWRSQKKNPRCSWTKPTHKSNLTIYQQTPSISFRVSNGGEEKLKKTEGKMWDFLQSTWGLSHSHSGAPKLLISLANLVDLHLRGSEVDSSALVWAQWCFSISYGTGLGSVVLPRGSWSLSISRKRGRYGRKRGRDKYTEWYQRGEREREIGEWEEEIEKERKSNRLFRLPTIY